MAQSLADITGLETIKTLVGCIGVPDFTVDELAEQTGVSPRTVHTVRRRYQHAFERLPSRGQTRPGRPPVRWRLRSDHLDEIVAAVESHRSALSISWRAEVVGPPRTDRAEASLIMAAVAIARSSDDATEMKQLVEAARHSLAAAGFGPDGSIKVGQPNQTLSSKASLVAAVTDVVDACITGDQQRIDEAQARAMPHVVEAAQHLSATEWFPLAHRVALAPGTVLSVPVLVAQDSVRYFHRLFPTLKAYTEERDVPAGFVCMTDTRAWKWARADPVTSLICYRDPAEIKREVTSAANPSDCVIVSRSPEVLEHVMDYGAHFILHRGNKATQSRIANVVNWRAVGFDLMGEIGQKHI